MKTMKPAAALFVLVIMVLSVVGIAMNSASFSQQPAAKEIPNVIREPLSSEERIYILQNGRVLIEHFYTSDCQDCLEKNAELESFVSRLEGYAVLNSYEIEGNETEPLMDMIGANGRIVDLEGRSLDYESLMDPYCEIAIAQPRACLLRDI